MVEAVPDVFGVSESSWNVETSGLSAMISKKHSLKDCAIEWKSDVGVPVEERMGWMRVSCRP
jgi:hypothetical protein